MIGVEGSSSRRYTVLSCVEFSSVGRSWEDRIWRTTLTWWAKSWWAAIRTAEANSARTGSAVLIAASVSSASMFKVLIDTPILQFLSILSSGWQMFQTVGLQHSKRQSPSRPWFWWVTTTSKATAIHNAALRNCRNGQNGCLYFTVFYSTKNVYVVIIAAKTISTIQQTINYTPEALRFSLSLAMEVFPNCSTDVFISFARYSRKKFCPSFQKSLRNGIFTASSSHS